MIINHNIAALNTLNHLNAATNAQSKAMQKLSSGLRINSAADDAAGLAISEKMRGQIRGLDQAGKNAQDSISMIQTAEGALNETHDILQRMRELAVQAGNDTNTTDDRAEIQKEMNQLTSEINRIGNTTEFNTQKLLNGTAGHVTPATTTPAKVTGSAVDFTSPVDLSSDKEAKFDIKVGSGKAVSVTVGGSSTSASNIDNLVSAVSDALSKASVSGVKVGKDGNKLTLTAENATDAITISNVSGTGIGLTAGTTNPTATSATSSFITQIGANKDQTMTLEFSDMRAAALGITGIGSGFTSSATVTDGTNNNLAENALDVSNAENAGNAVTVIQNAIDRVSAERSKLGAYQNRLEHTINNLSTSSENLTSAESRIRDVDYALAA
ncbi:flagellin [Heyndrickxia coagulans]|uniref:Flagellin n=1 Tax=Heyndrickxia coagulans DSM 1 = ATCC 7050 TaxID=1121088 RepID=A0A8B4BTU0_HEYCO|nr:flagellin [Heyndrickxia coagulans]AJH78326.1 flagellin [Heyndrickxia coagulans DSM 1 = ATCC 7050]MCR2846503.1 flagellin [Heyndrickxia coagulans]MDR4224684.1 flagellin [Heyndrickxia coagulans DSM 1 = ATCC 7050]MED4493073.1 flagellin [Heyndrickxia coagulans]MED4537405.1 flagellin [Heyndrickxia coagulans]